MQERLLVHLRHRSHRDRPAKMQGEEGIDKKQTVNRTTLKVVYFDFAGKAEAIRLACSYGNLPWEDVRVSFEKFQDIKREGKLKFGQLPALFVSDENGTETVVNQTSAIMRYVGKLSGLYPKNDDLYAALIDSILDQEADLFAGLTVSRYRDRFGFQFMTAADIAASRKALNDTILPRHLQALEDLMSKSSSGWIAGGVGPSIADFVLTPRLQRLVELGADEGISEQILEPYPKLRNMIKKVLELPAVVEYYSRVTTNAK